MAAFSRLTHVAGRSLSGVGKLNTGVALHPCHRNVLVPNHHERALFSLCRIQDRRYLVGKVTFVKDKHTVLGSHVLPGLKGSPLPLFASSLGVRFNSTVSVGKDISEGTNISGYIPEPPPLPVPDTTEAVTQALNALGEPTLASLGLCNYTPVGFIQACLEQLHVSVGLPWWGAIMATTICLRLIVFPLVIMGQRNAANMSNHMPVVQRLQERFMEARKTGNQMEAARTGSEMMQYMKRNNVNPMKNMIVPFAQLPIFVSVFVGMRQMAQLPVESMQTGGLFWFSDLTIQDPFYALPLITMATFLLTIEVGADGVRAGALGQNAKYVFRAMPFLMLPFIWKFPSAMLCYWLTSNVISLIQVLFLKMPAVRTFFAIPELVKHEQSRLPKKKFVEGFKHSLDNSRLMAEIQDRHRQDALRFKQAGTAPIQKTYKYDPTKGKKKAK